MFAFLWTRLSGAFRTKVGIALVAALVLGGGGTAMAMATSHGSPFSALQVSQSASSTPHAKKTAGKDDQDDQDDQECAGSPHATPGAHSDDGDEHESGTPSATRAAGQDDDEANEHEGGQDDDECGKDTATRTPHPEPTERPEETHTAGATPTKGPGGD